MAKNGLTDLATIVAAMTPAPWSADIRTGQALIWADNDADQTCGANALARLDRGHVWDQDANGGAGGWTLPARTIADAEGIAALRNAADDLATLLDAVSLWYERAEDGDRDMIADAEDLYRAVRDWRERGS